MRILREAMRRVTGPLTALLVATAAVAAPGVGEFSLDRAALTAVLSAGLPRTEEITVPALGRLSFTVDSVESLRFEDAELVSRLRIGLDRPPLRGLLEVRYTPRIDPLSGVARLEARTARAVAPMRIDVDLAPWLPPIELPRRVDWKLEIDGEESVDLVLFVQGVAVTDDRLRLDLGVVARRSDLE